MLGGITVKDVAYIKPNMNNLKGRRGKAVLSEIRNAKAPKMDDVRKDADACMKRLLATREHAK